MKVWFHNNRTIGGNMDNYKELREWLEPQIALSESLLEENGYDLYDENCISENAWKNALMHVLNHITEATE